MMRVAVPVTGSAARGLCPLDPRRGGCGLPGPRGFVRGREREGLTRPPVTKGTPCPSLSLPQWNRGSGRLLPPGGGFGGLAPRRAPDTRSLPA